jgi:cytochrome P450
MHPAFAEENALNPFPWYREMRESALVHFDQRFSSWNVFGYGDVQRVLSEHTTFSSEYGGQAGRDPLASSLINTDPPRHRQLRTLVTQAFTPRAVAQLGPRISQITHELLDRVAGAGEMDLVGDLAYPLPVIVIAEMLGIPTEDRDRFKRWSDAIVSGSDEGLAQTVGEGTNPHVEMATYFMQMIERRRQEPQDDLISALLAAQIDGEHLSQMELLGFCILLLIAGNETTTNLIGNAILCLDEHPDALERLRDEPELWPSAIEEVLRYLSPVQSMYRVAKTDATLGDQEIRAGQFVIAWIGSANRDEVQFPAADTFDITRTPNRHLAFGHGIHFCLGAPLARLEASIALPAIVERLPNLKRRHEVPLRPMGGTIVFGTRNLPVTFTPSRAPR